MARWKLTEPHYLNVPGNEWEQVLTDRVTQRPVRKKFQVPLHLDPRIESDWNYGPEGDRPIRQGDMDGQIIVCWEGKGLARDIVFVGNPTPGMLPLDDEARAVTAQFTWTPTERVSDGFIPDEASHQAKILSGLMKQIADATVAGPAAPAGFEKFMESMAAMMEQQTKLFAMLLGKQQEVEFHRQAEALGEARPEPEEPLEAVEPTAEELAEASAAAAKAEAASRAKAAAHVASRRV